MNERICDSGCPPFAHHHATRSGLQTICAHSLVVLKSVTYDSADGDGTITEVTAYYCGRCGQVVTPTTEGVGS